MNTEERAAILNRFVEYIETHSQNNELTIAPEINDLNFNEANLPKLDVVEDLMLYHRDITGTIEKTYQEVRDVMIHMKSLKSRKRNVQIGIDAMTACIETKRLSYGLGTDPR